MKYILFRCFLIYIIIYLILQLSKKKKNETFVNVKPSGKDWLEEIFDSRQIITIPDRIDHVKDFCSSFHINETIFHAIMKDDISYNNIHGLKIGEIACALSQEKVLNDFILSKHSTLLMFEDDNIGFRNDIYKNSEINLNHIKTYINDVVIRLPNDWDVLYLGRCWDNCNKHIKINQYVYKTHRTLCHHAIAFSRNGAEKILAAIKHPLSKPIDHIVASLATNGIIDSYASVIPIFYQNRDEMSSTIGNYDHLPVCM